MKTLRRSTAFPDQSPGATVPNDSRPQILIVDDDRAVRETLALLLLSAGYEVTTAENGIHALHQLDQRLPDLIISDLDMPLMSGLELIARVKRQYPTVSVIAMSGNYLGDAVPAALVADKFYYKGEDVRLFLQGVATLMTDIPNRDRSSVGKSAS